MPRYVMQNRPANRHFHFDGDAEGFSHTNAFSLALAADLAYLDETQVEAVACNRWGFEGVEFIEKSIPRGPDTQLFVAWRLETDDPIIVVSFRGTEPTLLKSDWTTDAKIKMTDGPFGKVHRGFQQALKAVWSQLTKRLQNLELHCQEGGIPATVWFTGHSLGGALAEVAAAKLLDDFDFPITGLYTFGKPRVGDSDYAKFMGQLAGGWSYRFVNRSDIVPRVPPRILGYRHVGQLRFIDSVGEIHAGVSQWNKMLLAFKAWAAWQTGNKAALAKPFSDHSMEEYLKALE